MALCDAVGRDVTRDCTPTIVVVLNRSKLRNAVCDTTDILQNRIRNIPEVLP
jgi:hypothetical protein